MSATDTDDKIILGILFFFICLVIYKSYQPLKEHLDIKYVHSKALFTLKTNLNVCLDFCKGNTACSSIVYYPITHQCSGYTDENPVKPTKTRRVFKIKSHYSK